jgi:excisionase family DNA binding protein
MKLESGNGKPAGHASSFLAARLRSLTFSDPGVRGEARAALDDVWPRLETLTDLVLNHPDHRVRTGAAVRLGVQGHDNRDIAVSSLRSALDDSVRHVVREAIRSLKHLGAAEAVCDYVGALSDPDTGVVIAAVEAIVPLGAPAMAAHLLPVLRREDKRLQLAVLIGIERLNWREAAPELDRFLDSLRGKPQRAEIDFNVPALCMRLLGGWRVREAGPVLVRFVREEVGLRSKALDALQRLGCPEAAAALVPTLAEAYGDRHADDLAMKMLDLMAVADCRQSLPAVLTRRCARRWLSPWPTWARCRRRRRRRCASCLRFRRRGGDALHLTAKQVAERLSLSRAQVHALIASGKLPCHRFGNGRGAIRVSEEQLAAFLEATKFKPAAELPELRHIQLHDGQRPAGASASPTGERSAAESS